MKTILSTLLLLAVTSAALAENKNALENRIRKLAHRLESLQSQSESAIPSEKLQKAVGIILMDRTKGGFIFGYEEGRGVAMVKNDKDQWSPVSFMRSHEGSFGAQIGGKNTFAVILLMHDSAKDRLVESKVKFGGEAGGTAGSSSGSTKDNPEQDAPVLVYGTSSGVYGGATVQGGTVTADEKANTTYYGRYYSPKEILFDREVEPCEAAVELAETITELSKSKE